MFAVIYRAHLKPDREAEYIRMWHKIALYFKEHRGALGSSLHKTDDGLWIAYSRWPTKEVRDASWPSDKKAISAELPAEIQEAIKIVKDCLDDERKFPEISMDVIDDLLVK